MIISIITFLLAFLLDNFLNTYINISNISILIPLFSVVSLILIYPYFNNNDSNFYKISFVFGLIYGITYSNMFIYDACIFLLIAILIKFINEILSNNNINVIIMGIIVIIIYNIINTIILNIINYSNITNDFLFKTIINHLTLNSIFLLLGNIILIYISKKYKLKRIN
jgi:cell shape-determining protein MreD